MSFFMIIFNYNKLITITHKIMTNSQKMQEVTEVNVLLCGSGLEDLVDTRVEVMENQYGKKTPHIVATYTETKSKVDPEGNSFLYVDEVTEKIEELNNYFSGEIFAMGITQRADWLKATTADRVAYLDRPGFHHPAGYKAVAKTPKYKKRPNKLKYNKYPNGYQGKIDFYMDMAAEAMGTDKYTYYDRKVKYFLGRQDEWLLTQNC